MQPLHGVCMHHDPGESLANTTCRTHRHTGTARRSVLRAGTEVGLKTFKVTYLRSFSTRTPPLFPHSPGICSQRRDRKRPVALLLPRGGVHYSTPGDHLPHYDLTPTTLMNIQLRKQAVPLKHSKSPYARQPSIHIRILLDRILRYGFLRLLHTGYTLTLRNMDKIWNPMNECKTRPRMYFVYM